MAPDKCCYLIFSGNPSNNMNLQLNFYGLNISHSDSPIFLDYVGAFIESSSNVTGYPNGASKHSLSSCLGYLIELFCNRFLTINFVKWFNIYPGLIKN
ncbi:hypothetical protein BpHYR1_031295 [Brachionus plicatilis]|uniref:Uncharacterized protein n=1 Tax=Brachionus plicatilis TaxID=10195 RepID=A0A3M7P579_BRAPC|nr:hypothetical protein BpHYR1_031295 [Brachionus plicatilis]